MDNNIKKLPGEASFSQEGLVGYNFDLDNKYAFKYDLDGITGTYVWDSRRQNFALQTSNSVNVAEDYIFADVLDDTSQQWADEKYFLENKTRDDILQSSWWKFVMTKDRLFIKKGEV